MYGIIENWKELNLLRITTLYQEVQEHGTMWKEILQDQEEDHQEVTQEKEGDKEEEYKKENKEKDETQKVSRFISENRIFYGGVNRIHTPGVLYSL